MASVFESYTVEDIRKRLSELKGSTGQDPSAVDPHREAKSSLAFFSGDYWQRGDAWVGPRPPLGHPNPGAFYAAIKQDLISKNIIKEVVRRDRNGVIGREPNWTITVRRELKKKEEPNEQEQELIAEANSALLNWWDTRRYGKRVVLATLQGGTDVLNASGRGPLRLWIPPAKIDDKGALKDEAKVRNNPGAAMQLLYLMNPEYEQGVVITDDDSQEQAGVYITKKKNSTDDKIELVFLNDENQTVIRIFEKDKPSDSKPYVLGGMLTIYEMNRDPLISPQVKQMAKLFTMSATMRTRTVSQAGFPERTFIGAKPPSHLEDDPDNEGEKVEVPDAYQTGVGTTQFVQVQEIVGEDGKVKAYAGAQLKYRDPVKVTTFDQTEKAAYNNILSEVNQSYVTISGDATSSGESRIQARADFVMALRETKSQVDAAGRWVLETALAWAADLSGQPGRYAELRVNFDCRLDPGPLSAQERALVAEEVEKRLRSREDAMTLLGIDDPDAMLDQIVAEGNALNPANAINTQRAAVALERDKQSATGNPDEIQARILADRLALENQPPPS